MINPTPLGTHSPHTNLKRRQHPPPPLPRSTDRSPSAFRSAIRRSLARPQMKKATVVQQLLQVCSPSPQEIEEDVAPPKMTCLPPPPPPLPGTSDGCANASLYKRRQLSKQKSMRETKMEAKWERRRRQILERRRRLAEGEEEAAASAERGETGGAKGLTDEDLDELRGSIDLGFGFNEEAGGHDLCDTLPALNLYFAVHRQLSDPKLLLSSSPSSTPRAAASSSIPSPPSPIEQAQCATASSSDYWKICHPGDNPQHVKTRLRHWAQAVACSLRQSC